MFNVMLMVGSVLLLGSGWWSAHQRARYWHDAWVQELRRRHAVEDAHHQWVLKLGRGGDA